ncbi:MAG: tRNA pseudouridine(55) synthase TruB [Bacteroidota bacterium]
MDFIEGEIILINKDTGWTSFDVVNKIRYILRSGLSVKKIKVGHAGTLDPLATGLLVVCTGKATKSIMNIQDSQKEYVADFMFGKTTPSFDRETEVDQFYETGHIDIASIEKTIEMFTGKIMQVPPVYSAVKVNGTRAYKHARKGDTPVLRPREVEINRIEILDNNFPLMKFRIVCGKGTYIRALARDFGQATGSGAYLETLCRTRIGNYQLNDALSISEFEDKISGLRILL